MMSSTPELNGCDSSPTSIHSSNGGGSINNECKSLPPLGPPPLPPTSSEQIREYVTETNYSPPSSAISTTTHSPTATGAATLPTLQQQPQQQHNPSADYASYQQHRGGAGGGNGLIYQSTPVPQPNVYMNSMYMPETTNAYSKNLSEHFVSDHLPKRENNKYASKKSIPQQAKDTPPNIPKFPGPYFINNNVPNYVNRNMKDKDYRYMGGNKNGDAKMSPQQQQRLVRNLANGNNSTYKPKVFVNQNQYGGPPRPKSDRMMSQNGHHLRNGPGGGISRQASYDMNAAPTSLYGAYPGYPSYPKNTGYEGYRKQVSRFERLA